MVRKPVFEEGKNCWRVAMADRVSLLVDGEEYFSALCAALERARTSILIVGWDVHSRVVLRRDDGTHGLPSQLGDLLNELARRRRGLHVHVLDWDFAMIYALERQVLPAWQINWQRHRRVHFAFDGEHPVGASHHHKLVVVDDRLAFVGGLDLTAQRWDTREHRPDDPRRAGPNGKPYEPFHDVQMAVEGDAARVLGDLVRERWRRARGETPARPKVAGDVWPPALAAHLRNVDIAVARTAGAWKEQPEIREIEALYVEMIDAARRSIYVENQYLTSTVIGEALCRRLREPDGPEIVVVLPRDCHGWLEELTMGVLRKRLVEKLRHADAFGRLGIFYPVAKRRPETPVHVHAKIIVVDDEMLQIGSANLNNRSMGLDTECNLAIDRAGDAQGCDAIRRFRDGLLAEHCGVPADAVGETLARTGSLIATIAAVNGGSRTLLPLDPKVEAWADAMVPDATLLDPEQPVEIGELVEQVLHDDIVEPLLGPRGRIIVGILVALALAAVWQWTPAARWLEPSRVAAWAEHLRHEPVGWLACIIVFAIAGTLLVPVTGLIATAGLLFDLRFAFLCALGGSLLGATLGYEIGRLLWRDAVRQLGGKWLNRLNHLLSEGGILAVVMVRMLPIAPFGIINMVAGSLHVRWRHFFIGTLLGMSPGMIAIILLTHHAARVARNPNLETIITGVFVAGAAVAAVLWLRRVLSHRAPRSISKHD